MSTYEEKVSPNHSPHYDLALGDTLRMGSFVYLRDKKGNEHVGRLECRQIDESDIEISIDIRIRLFHPLFKKSSNPEKYKPPKHSFPPLLQGVGSQQVELYESMDCVWVPNRPSSKPPVLIFPTFVFTLEELALPKNSWAIGLYNVYVVRFHETKNYDAVYELPKKVLCRLPKHAKFGFSNDHPKYDKPAKYIVPQRCLHESIWIGLYSLKKGLTKALNKRSGQSADKETITLNLGLMPNEVIWYISLVCNHLSKLDSHPISLSESYFHLDANLRRSKIKIAFNAGIIRFQTERELAILRMILGPGSTYGFSERRPTLKDGSDGLVIKRGQNMTVVAPSPQDSQTTERPFKRRTYEPRVDFTFSPYSVRLTVGYQRFNYAIKKDGSMEESPPCPNLKRLLDGHTLDDCSSSSSESELDVDNQGDDINEALNVIQIGSQFLFHGHSVMEVTKITKKEQSQHVFTCRCVGGSKFLLDEPVDKQWSYDRNDTLQLLDDITLFS